MPNRTFTPDQLTAIGVPNDLVTAAFVDANPEYVTENPDAAIELHDEQVGTRRWVSVHHLVFRAPDDKRAWRIEYVQGLTESQEDISPWEYAGATVEAVEVEQVPSTVMEWRAVPDVPPTPSDAELIEHARAVGMVEPERAPEFVAAYRAHVEKQSAAHAAQPVPQRADVEEQQRQAAQEQPAPLSEAMNAAGRMAAEGLARGIAQAAPADLFTEAAIYASALHAGADAIDKAFHGEPFLSYPPEFAQLLRRMAGAKEAPPVEEQPAPLTMADRNAHAVGLYATTAVDLEDARRDVATLRARVSELEAAAAPLKPTEREFLTYALDLAAGRMASRDGFTDEDTAALDTLRRLAATLTAPTVAEALARHPDQQAGRRAILDSLGTVAHVAIWTAPGDDDTENTETVIVEAGHAGTTRRIAAYMLRQVAARLDADATAHNEAPLDDDARADADARNEHLDAGVPLTPAEIEQGQADADALAAEHPDTVESLLDELADDIPNRRAPRIAANYLARYTRLLVADARERMSQRNAEMRAEGYRGRVAWTSGMREVAALLDARADALNEAGR